MAYRRGYFFNANEYFNWLKAYSEREISFFRLRTIIGLRQLSTFEKYQIENIVVKLMPYDRTGYRAIILLKSGKTVEYPLGENKGYWIDD